MADKGGSVAGRRRSAAERVEPIERPTHAHQPPYVEAMDYIRVRALVRGQHVDGVVLGWRGDRVYVTWRSDMGDHLGCVSAANVERR